MTIDEEQFAREVAQLRARKEWEAKHAEQLKREWNAYVQSYYDAVKTEEGLAMIEDLVDGPNDALGFGANELARYVKPLIAEVRRLRAAMPNQIQIGGSNNKQEIK